MYIYIYIICICNCIHLQEVPSEVRDGADIGLARNGFAKCPPGKPPRVRERGGAPTMGGDSTIFVPPNASVQSGDLTVRTKNWLLGAGFLGAPPDSLTEVASWCAEAL